MSRLWRWIKRLVLVVLVLVLVLLIAMGGVFAWLVARGMPQRDGVAHIPGLSAQVRVVRDANGIPNIYAASTHDLFAAQGYVHASERMWQMEIWRRIGAGRLSELFGDTSLGNDKFIRTLGWRQAAEADWMVMSPAGKEALQAYADGINAWLDQHGDLPLPFVIAGFQGAGGGLAGFHPEHWTPIDTLTWQKVQAWSLGDNYGVELTRSIMLKQGLTVEQINQLTPGYDPSRPVITPEFAAAGAVLPSVSVPATHLTSATATRMLDAATRLRQTIAMAGAGAALSGSNGIAIAPSRSASGGALLANDPHLEISMPSVWYAIGLHCELPASPSCPYELTGVGFPGVPGIVLGHNARIAWGFTNTGPDTQDIFEETLDPTDHARYRYKGQSLPFSTHTETIRVAGGDSVTLEVRSTVHGPVMDDVDSTFDPTDEGGAGLGREGYVYTMAWAATMQPDRALDAILALNRAANWDEFRAAARDFGAPSQTMLYADVDGHIGVQIPGWFPVRASGDGSFPVNGEDGAHDWRGFVPFDELPYLFDPEDGVIVAANNQPAAPGSGPFIGKDFDPGYRAARIHELLDAAGPIATDLLRSIQGDVKLTRAAPVIAAVAAQPQASNADSELLRQRIVDWAADLTCTTSSKGCAAYEEFEYWLLRYTFQDELGAGIEPIDAGWRYVGSEPSHEFIGILADQPHNAWWDDVSTPGTEGRDAIIVRALDRAAAELRATVGDAAFWEWGRLHTVTFEEQTLGTSGIGPLEWIFNKGPFAAPGSCTTVLKNCGSISNDWPPEGDTGNLTARFATGSSPSYRLVVDMSDLDAATILFTTGESGVPFDAHYGDFISRWLENSPLPLNWTSGAVDAAAKQTLLLQP